MSEMTDISRSAVEQHLDISTNHEAGLIPTATVIIVRALLARAETAEALVSKEALQALSSLDQAREAYAAQVQAEAERDDLRAEVERLREALAPFADALKSARGRMGEMPSDRADVTAIACRFITYDHLKDALSEFAQTEFNQ